MDFTNRSGPTQNLDVEPATTPSTPSIPSHNSSNLKRSNSNSKSLANGQWTRIGMLVGLVAVVILIIGVIVLVASNNSNSKDSTEFTYAKSGKLQAVFLNTGQVYFGNIQTLNNNFLILSNIFYLQTSSNGSSSTSTSTSTSASNVTLVKLGCELHRPYDQMVINRSQVTFWENLESNGQVATAVATYQKNNPGPQKCADQSTSAGTSTGTSAQGATGNTKP